MDAKSEAVPGARKAAAGRFGVNAAVRRIPTALAVFATTGLAMASIGLVFALAGCDGGTSSETVGIEAMAGPASIGGRTASGVLIGLYAEEYLPHLKEGYADSIEAGANGEYSFENLPPGRYRVIARRPADGRTGMISDLEIPSETSTARSAALEPAGTVSGTVTDSLPAFQGLVFARGTPFYTQSDSQMRFVLAGLPPGGYDLVKTWERPMDCEPGRACGGVETRADSAFVQVKSEAETQW